MTEIKSSTGDRLPAFDNLRFLMVALVLVFHSAASYSSAVDFWPFHDTDSSILIDLFMLLCDMFMMPVLFFVAGYFALPSLNRNSAKSFVTKKLKRLGLPWLIITFLVMPTTDFFHYVNHSSGTMDSVRSYGAHWLVSVKKILEFRVGWLDMSSYLDMTQHFYQRYVWFISLLLLFFLVLAAIQPIYRKLSRKQTAGSPGAKSKKSDWLTILIVVIVNIILFGLFRFLAYPEFMASGWFSLGNIIQFQVGKLTIFVCYFILGMIAYQNQWFSNIGTLGKFWIWLVACFCLFGLNMMVMKTLNESTNAALSYKLGFVSLYPLWTFSFLGLFVSICLRFWNRTTKVNASLSKHSYDMYLVHYVVPLMLPLALAGWDIPVGIKFLTTATMTLVFSYLVSRFLVKAFPKLTLALIVAFNLALGIAS